MTGSVKLFLNLEVATSFKFWQITCIFWYEQNRKNIPGYKREVVLVMLCYCGCKQ